MQGFDGLLYVNADTGKYLGAHVCDTSGSSFQPIPLRVLANSLQKQFYRPLDFVLVHFPWHLLLRSP
jgi:hypothetical protein